MSTQSNLNNRELTKNSAATDNSTTNKPKLSRAEQTRINGAKSRGPKTEEGKQRSSRNAFKHGLTSNVILTEEDPREFQHLIDIWTAELKPESTAQRTLVRKLALAEFRLQRTVALNTNMLDYETDTRAQKHFEAWPTLTRTGVIALSFRDANEEHRAFEILRRYETQFDRAFSRNIRLLFDLQDRLEKRAKRRKPAAQADKSHKNQPVASNRKAK